MKSEDFQALIESRKLATEKFPLMTIKDVHNAYGISVRTLRRWQAAGLMPEQVKHGRHLKYRKEEVALMMAAKKVKSNASRAYSGS